MFRWTSADQPINLPTFFSLEIVWLENTLLNDIDYPGLYGSAHKYPQVLHLLGKPCIARGLQRPASMGSTGHLARWQGSLTLCGPGSAACITELHKGNCRGGGRGGGGLISGACQVKPYLPASISSAHTSKLEATASRRSLRPLTSQWMDTRPMCMTQSN